jgi:hypothetical protein
MVIFYSGCSKRADDGWGYSNLLWRVVTYGEMPGGVDTATIGYNPDSTIRRIGHSIFSGLDYTEFSYSPGGIRAYTMKSNGYPFIDSFVLDVSGRVVYHYLDIKDNHEYNSEDRYTYSPGGELMQKVTAFPNLGITIDTYDYVWAHGDLIREISRMGRDTSLYAYDTTRPCAPGDIRYMNAFLQTGIRHAPNRHLNTRWSWRRQDTLVYHYDFDDAGRILGVRATHGPPTESRSDYFYY